MDELSCESDEVSSRPQGESNGPHRESKPSIKRNPRARPHSNRGIAAPKSGSPYRKHVQRDEETLRNQNPSAMMPTSVANTANRLSRPKSDDPRPRARQTDGSLDRRNVARPKPDSLKQNPSWMLTARRSQLPRNPTRCIFSSLSNIWGCFQKCGVM